MDAAIKRTRSVNWKFIGVAVGSAALLTLGAILTKLSFAPFIIRWASPFGSDWSTIFRPAIMGGGYIIPGFFSPPWLLAIMAPFSLLPRGIDVVVIVIVSIASWIFVMRRLGASALVIALMLMTPQLWWGIIYGNVDFLVPLGLVLPPQIGLFFVLSKPQAGFGIAIFWLFEAWRKGGLLRVAWTFGPIAVVSLLACIPFGFWPAHLFAANATYWNISPFPYLVPVGLIFLYRAVRNRQQGLSIISAPFLAPYVGVQSLPVAVLGLLPSQTEAIIAIVSLWFIWLMCGTT